MIYKYKVNVFFLFCKEKTDFFKAPASTRFHGNYEGGLVEHSMQVYEILKHKVENCVIDIDVKEIHSLQNPYEDILKIIEAYK